MEKELNIQKMEKFYMKVILLMINMRKIENMLLKIMSTILGKNKMI